MKQKFPELGRQRQIYIKTTETCQMRCKHCYIGDNRFKKGFFNEVQTVKWIKDWCKLCNINESDLLITFHGGEPFMCPLPKLKYVTNAFPTATFNTTSNLVFPLDHNKMEFILTKFIDPIIKKPFIKTSWDPVIRFMSANQLHQWESNVKLLKEKGVFIQCIMCLTSHSLKLNPKKLYDYMENLGIDILDFERLTVNTTAYPDLIPDYKVQDEWLYKAYQFSKGRKLKIGTFAALRQSVLGQHIGCRTRSCMKNVLTINADGSIGGCPNTAIQNGYSHINKNPSDIIFNNCRNCLIQREQIRDSRCYACELFKVCNGDCHQLSWQGDYCPAPKKVMQAMIKEYDEEKFADFDLNRGH